MRILCLLQVCSALRVLVSGDQSTTFFESVALELKSHQHSVYKMSRYLDPVYKAQSQQGIMLYGIGKHPDKFVSQTDDEDPLA